MFSFQMIIFHIYNFILKFIKIWSKNKNFAIFALFEQYSIFISTGPLSFWQRFYF